MGGLSADFVLSHNVHNQHTEPAENLIAPYCVIHPTAVVGEDGAKIVKTRVGLVKMKHVGNVVMAPYVEVGAYTVIHRGTLESTVIGWGTKIGSLCSVGHNSIIGQDCILTARVGIAGSCKIGDRCFFGINSTVIHKISICDDVLIGAGAVVISDITRPGKYVGNPARRIGDWDGTW